MKRLKTTVAALALCLASASAMACQVEGKGEVNFLSNSIPVFEVISNAMKACEKDGLRVTFKITRDHQQEHAGFMGNSNPYEVVGVANGSIAPLIGAGVLSPMNDLVAKYGKKYGLEDSMLIKVGDDILAIAFMVNAQHLFYRKDVFEKNGITPPTNYTELIAAAEKLKTEKDIQFPLSGTMRAGWNLGQEFTNLYLGMGGTFFKPGTAEPAIVNETAIKTLDMLKKLTSYMSPNALNLDTTAVMQEFQQGQVAMANMWASRAAQMDDPKESKVVDKIAFAKAPAATAGGKPATTIWWDGFVMPKNMDGNRDLAFQLMMEGLKASVVEQNNDVAIWIRSNFKAGRYAIGSAESAVAGAPAYPMTPQQSLIHSAIGANIGDFMAGKESAEQSLKDSEIAYREAAKEKGLLK